MCQFCSKDIMGSESGNKLSQGHILFPVGDLWCEYAHYSDPANTVAKVANIPASPLRSSTFVQDLQTDEIRHYL